MNENRPLSRETYLELAAVAKRAGWPLLANYYLRRAVDACVAAYEGAS